MPKPPKPPEEQRKKQLKFNSTQELYEFTVASTKRFKFKSKNDYVEAAIRYLALKLEESNGARDGNGFPVLPTMTQAMARGRPQKSLRPGRS